MSASIAIGLLGAALVRTHTATPTARPSPFIGSTAQGGIAVPAGGIGTAAIAQRTLVSTGAPEMTVQPDRGEGSPTPAALEKSPAVAPAHRRAGDELTFVAPSEPPSYDAHWQETLALIHSAAPHSNTLPRTAMLSAGGRHAGSVLSVGPDSLVVGELGRAGEEQKLSVTITRKTRIIESHRNPGASGAQDAFTDKTISLAEVEKGDYVVVDASRQETKLIAASIIVTLRHETQVVRPDPNDSAPPTTGATSVAPRFEQRKPSPAPTASAMAPAQQPAPYDGEDPRAVIEWLLYPASGRTRRAGVATAARLLRAVAAL